MTRLSELRSLALHRAVAERVRADPEVVARARDRVAGWLRTGVVHPRYAQAWDELLALPAERIAEALVETSERAHDLRQVSPFAGALAPRERWRILRSVG